MALHACPACKRTFEEPGFCPYDRTALVSLASNPAAETQMSMAMPAATAAQYISGRLDITDPLASHKTNLEPHRTFPIAGAPTPTSQPPAVVTQEITSTVNRAAPPPKSEPIRAVSASENPQEVLEAFRASRDSEYDRLVGQTLDGRYHVIKKIGEGGMGVVFSARHAVIERPLAIKVLKREVMRDTATIQRFIQEAKAASRIGHPNIVDVTDFGTTPDGMTYSVMEFVVGETLGATIRASAPFPIQRAIRVAAQIARALGAAHDKGIVHRDLKPENVFLVDRDQRPDFVKIVDFGIAKIVPIDGKAQEGPRLTRAGSVFGTPEYMAPEQAAGRSDTDGRVDIYALGVILYEMLCGRVPHKGDTMVRTLAMQMLDAVEPPSKVAPQAGIPPELEAVVLKALAKKREQRYQKMSELLAALEHVQATVMPPPVAQSVTGSPVYSLQPLPPGADSVPPPPGSIPPGTASNPMPIVSGSFPPTNQPRSHAPTNQPPTRSKSPTNQAPTRSKSPTNQVTTRPKNEPQFVTSEKPITFEHMYTDEHVAVKPPGARWPLLVLIALILGGAAGAVIYVVKKRGAAAAHEVDAAVVALTKPDAQVLADGGVEPDAPIAPVPGDAADVIAPADARAKITVPANRRDGGAGGSGDSSGPVMIPDTPTGRGTIIVEVLTKPETAHVYTGTSYRGPSGAKLEYPIGTKVEVRCQQNGYKPGVVSVVFDGKTEYVLCALERIKTCVETLANPFDRCPDAGVP